MNIKTLKRIYITFNRILFFPFILKDFLVYRKKLSLDSSFKASYLDSFPQIFDNTVNTGFDRHYIYHTAWAARKVAEINPKLHIDISSSLYFCGIVSAFVPVKFYDYRPAILNLSNLVSNEGNLLNLPFESNSVFSISCMHTIEHIGLGRYGDEIDPEGDLKAINELKRVVSIGGNILFVTPVGTQKLMFNAHRIYSYEKIIQLFEGLKLIEFSLIHQYEENGGITINACPGLVQNEEYGCGCFWFKK